MVTVVGFVEVWQDRPPEHDQLEKVYPVGMLHAVAVLEPKFVLKNDAPLATPGAEQEPQFTVADEEGFVRTLTWAAYTAIRTPPELYAEQLAGLSPPFEHATPPVQVQ